MWLIFAVGVSNICSPLSCGQLKKKQQLSLLWGIIVPMLIFMANYTKLVGYSLMNQTSHSYHAINDNCVTLRGQIKEAASRLA